MDQANIKTTAKAASAPAARSMRASAGADSATATQFWVLMGALTAWLLYMFVLKSLLQERTLSFDGMFFLACFTLVLQEPWHAWIRPQLLYNDIFLNYGTWMGYLPVSSPVAYKTPLPIAFAGLGYFWIVAGPAYCGSRLTN